MSVVTERELASLPARATPCAWTLTGPCPERAHSRGYCKPHYKAALRAGILQPRDLTAVVPRGSSAKIAKAAIEANALIYAELHLRGARLAARKGDTRPAEWALLHSRAVEPVAKDAPASSGPGIVINVGVALPGLGNSLGSLTNSVVTSAPASAPVNACLPAPDASQTADVIDAESHAAPASAEREGVRLFPS